MNEAELDEIYTELCRAVTACGREAAPELLARFALLAMHEIDDAAALRRLIAMAAGRDADGSTARAGGAPEPRR